MSAVSCLAVFSCPAAPLAHGAVLGVHVAWLGVHGAWLGVHGAWLCVVISEGITPSRCLLLGIAEAHRLLSGRAYPAPLLLGIARLCAWPV